ncbi:MAG: ATP-binding protein [Pseudomonadota bacterium]
MSFRLKTVLGIALIEALLLTILVFNGLHYLSSSNAQQLEQRAATTAKLVATMTGDAVIAVDLATLDVLVDQALLNPDLEYLRIRSDSGVVLSEGGAADALAVPFQHDHSVEAAKQDGRLDVMAPIMVGGATFGHVELGLSTEVLEATFGDALTWMVSIALSEMILVALLGLALGHYLTRQLVRLNRGAETVAGGEFGYQIPVEGKDELAATATSFNKMSRSLAQYAALAEEARLKAEAGRMMAESTLQDALDSMRDAVLVVAVDGRVVLANQSYRALYGLTEKFSGDGGAAFALEAALNVGSAEAFIADRLERLNDPAGNARWEATLCDDRHLLVSQHPMSRGGVVIVQTDVSELYQALEENRQLHLELVQHQRTEAMGTLAGGIAHEVNTPVQIIADNAGFLASTVGDIVTMINSLADRQETAPHLAGDLESLGWEDLRQEIPQSLDDLADGTRRVRDLVTTFKQLAAPMGGAAGPTDLKSLIEMVADGTKGVWQPVATLEIDAADGLPAVHCQADQMKQVVGHLIGNAAHAIEDAGRADPGLITVRLFVEGETAVIEVCDNGCGIAPDHFERIFDILFTTKAPGRGTGQGLALCHAIVTRGHGGRITVDSTVGVATCFKVRLPLEPVPAAQAEPVAAQ